MQCKKRFRDFKTRWIDGSCDEFLENMPGVSAEGHLDLEQDDRYRKHLTAITKLNMELTQRMSELDRETTWRTTKWMMAAVVLAAVASALISGLISNYCDERAAASPLGNSTQSKATALDSTRD